MKKHQIALVFAILFGLLNLTTGQGCGQRDEAAAQAEDPTWTCLNACIINIDCSGTETCNCDGHCGMSCFNREAECPAITVDNGNFSFSNNLKYGSKATLTCTQAYTLAGEKVRTCRSDGAWSNSNNVPNCTHGCPPPSSTGNDFISSGNDNNAVGFPVGHVVTYSCNTGYDAAGNADRTCQSDFAWSSLLLSCTIRSCGAPPTIEHASHIGTNYNFGGTITYSCDKGYDLSGQAAFNCYADGVWSPENTFTACNPVLCIIPPQAPDNGVYVGGTTMEYGDIVEYSCNAGYKLNGPDQGRCNETWGDVPTCDASVDATFNEVQLDGYAVMSGTWARKRVNDYLDLPGYSLLGDGVVRSVSYPLTGDDKICVQAYIKDTQENELKAQAFQGGETRELHLFSASDVWKLEKFWLTPVNSSDTQVQLQFIATTGSNVLLDEIKKVNDAKCEPAQTTQEPPSSVPSSTTVSVTMTPQSGPGTMEYVIIGVVIVIACIVLIVMLIICCTRRRKAKKKRKRAATSEGDEGVTEMKPMVSSDEKGLM